MKMADALRVAAANARRDGATREIFLAVGFTPLHLRTMLLAHAAGRCGEARIDVTLGAYGDVVATLAAAEARRAACVAVVVEWADLDPRLGLRRAGGWTPADIDDCIATAAARLRLLADRILGLAQRGTVIVSPPTLPLPPAFTTPRVQADTRAIALRRTVLDFAGSLAASPHVRIVDGAALDAKSPPAERHDIAGELRVDFPYRVAHADALAEILADLAFPAPPLKGIITDLDDTLWQGLVGEVGADAVRWDLDGHAQIHALYQQTLAALAAQGVLVGVASKNTPDIAMAALRRADLRLTADSLFPIEISWGPKSDAVARILRTWNIHADSVVFVDDNPLELAEVRDRFPSIRTLQFTPHDAAAGVSLLRALRDWCGKPVLTKEDGLRLASIRAGQAYREAARHGAPDGAPGNAPGNAPGDAPGNPPGDVPTTAFLATLGANVGIDEVTDHGDARPLELINKTNQFNLNGRRITAREWSDLLRDPNIHVLVVSYDDKFGPLGKIGVVVCARGEGDEIVIRHWVQSCRAFSRKIEHRALWAIFELFHPAAVTLDLVATDRNTPITEFLAGLPTRSTPRGVSIDGAVLPMLRAETAHLATRLPPIVSRAGRAGNRDG